MQLTINYTTKTGDDVTVTTTPWSVACWERKYETKIGRIEDEKLGIEDLLYLAWEATKAADDGTVVPVFDTWARTVATIRTVDGDNPETRPTRPARRAG